MDDTIHDHRSDSTPTCCSANDRQRKLDSLRVFESTDLLRSQTCAVTDEQREDSCERQERTERGVLLQKANQSARQIRREERCFGPRKSSKSEHSGSLSLERDNHDQRVHKETPRQDVANACTLEAPSMRSVGDLLVGEEDRQLSRQPNQESRSVFDCRSFRSTSKQTSERSEGQENVLTTTSVQMR